MDTMRSTYSISFDPVARILNLRLQGIWDMATFAGYAAELGKAHERLAREEKRFGIYSDTSTFPVQKPEIAGAFAQMAGAMMQRVDVPAAIVVGTMLGKLQADRIFGGGHVRAFVSGDTARGWLVRQLATSLAA